MRINEILLYECMRQYLRCDNCIGLIYGNFEFTEKHLLDIVAFLQVSGKSKSWLA